MTPRRDVSMSDAAVSDLLAEPLTAVLSTLAHDGAPHAAGMWFVHRGGEILMWTYGKSQKAVNLRRDPRCAFLVEQGVAYNELRGVLVRGEVRIVVDVEEVAAIGRSLYERYTLPATGVPAERGPDAEIVRQAAKRVGLILPMEKVSSWDHSKL